MANITKVSKTSPVEGLRSEAQARVSVTSADITLAATNVSTFIEGYANSTVALSTTVPFVSGLALLPNTGTTDDISAPVVRAMLENLIQEYSRVRTIRFVRSGDGFTYERFARVDSPDSATSDNVLFDFGVIFPTNPVDQSEYIRVVAAAAAVMRTNFAKLFAIIPYCHVSCHVDIPPPPPAPIIGGGVEGPTGPTSGEIEVAQDGQDDGDGGDDAGAGPDSGAGDGGA
jgi:hypothetical protein